MVLTEVKEEGGHVAMHDVVAAVAVEVLGQVGASVQCPLLNNWMQSWMLMSKKSSERFNTSVVRKTLI